MRSRLASLLSGLMLSGLMLSGLTIAGAAQAADDDKKAPLSAETSELAPMPAPASARLSMRMGARTLNYTATIGAIPVRDENGKLQGEVVYTAYVLDGPRAPNRPVTFAFNGGPGASSVYLNLGVMGPKRVQFGAQGDSPSDPPLAQDNPWTWLDLTDMVFIDPVGTGFSRTRLNAEETKKKFWGTNQDIEYLSRVVYDWLVDNGRLTSPKYVVGESYGGFRGPRIAHMLQNDLGVGVRGVVMVSPLIGGLQRQRLDLSPMPWLTTLPSIAAAHLERQGKLTPQAMAEVEAYVRGDYARDLLKGTSDRAAIDRMVARVTELTGLDPKFVRRSAGRIDEDAYLREIWRDQGKLGSSYDSNVTAWDPFPWSPSQRSNDPILESIIAPTSSAMVDFVTRTVGWKAPGRYHALNYAVNRNWDRQPEAESVTDLSQALAADPKLKVLIVHGWNDVATPYFASRLIVDQMPAMGERDRVRVVAYPGGHMFYSRPDSASALRRDVEALYAGG